MLALIIWLFLLKFLPCHCTAQGLPAAYLQIYRRGSPLAQNVPADLDYLKRLLNHTEQRYARVKREIRENRLVRTWKARSTGTVEDETLLTYLGQNGSWYINLPIGPKDQSTEFDLDMLSPDFYTLQTTSGKGSRYNVFSQTHISNDARVHPLCKSPSDTIHLSSLDNETSVPILLPLCSPSKSSTATLLRSGSILGLSPANPSSSLSRLTSPSLLQQLLTKQTLTKNLVSLTLIDSMTGILSLGGTMAGHIEEVRIRTQVEVDSLADPSATTESRDKQVQGKMSSTFPTEMEDQFRWVPTRGAAQGWWTSLLTGIWINNAKVLKNQPVLLDIQSPFILAPPLAARRFYESIGGCARLPPPHDMLWKFPCLNRPKIMLEFGGWWFPILSGEGSSREASWGPAGGRLSLGKLPVQGNQTGSGYCVGRVVETGMGLRGGKDEDWEGIGMRDVWVLGEPAFWGVGVVLDSEKERIGFRNY